VKEELLNYFRKMEQDLVISKLHRELPVLQKQLQDYAEQTVSVRTKLEIHHNSVEICIGHRLGDKYREGLPSETPIASPASGAILKIIVVIIIIATFVILTKQH
jgi:hypothetical protein